MFFLTQGVCGTTGKSTGGKKSVRKLPRSESFQAKALFCLHMKSCIMLISAGRRKSVPWLFSISSFRSWVYRPVGTNGGGFGSSGGIDSSGLPMMFLRMRNLSGSS